MIKQHLKKWLGAFAMIGLMIGFAQTSSAQTQAGTTVTNDVTVSYSVNAVAQPDETTSNEFTVDRVINFTVVTTDTAAVAVGPSDTEVLLTFTVTNNGNDFQDFDLTALSFTGGDAKFGGLTDSFDMTSVTAVWDDDDDNVYNPALDDLDFINDLPFSGTGNVARVFIVGTAPASGTDGAIATYALRATAQVSDGDTLTLEQGANEVETGDTTVDDEDNIDVVFNDPAGTGPQAAGIPDIARDGIHSDQSDYEFESADIVVAKTSSVISDPILGVNTNAKRIPQAVVEYEITVTNNGSQEATSVSITDDLDTEIATNGTIAFHTDGYAAGQGFQVSINGAAFTNESSADDADGADFAANVVELDPAVTIPAGENVRLRYRVIIQ